MEIHQNVSLKDFSWWKIGGPADYFCLPKTQGEILEALKFADDKKLPLTILGGGTNVLISDQGIAGLTIGMRQFVGAEVQEDTQFVRVTALAGTPKSELTKIFLKRRLAPALFLCGLPGDVGGGIVMNAGVGEMIKPREFVELTEWVEWIDLTTKVIVKKSAKELKWTYRHSAGWEPGVITRVGLIWPNEPDATISRKVTDATKLRRSKQPLELPSCGSTFKNPDGQKAGALIDQAGLKGYQKGGAQVSMKHANFIVNNGGAKAADVKHIIDHVQSEVKKKFAVDLQCEVRLLGRW